jgi:lipid A ethanolaminephosphotransferase
MFDSRVRPPAARRVFLPALCLRFAATSDQLVLAAGLFWALAVNRPFFAAATRAHSSADGWSWSFVLALALMLAALHVLLAGLISTRRSVKPALALLALVAAFAQHFAQAYGTVLDPSMLRNALRTDLAETRELLSWRLALDLLLYAVLPIVLLFCAQVQPRPWRRALLSRGLLLGLAAVTFVGALWWQLQPMAALMRNHKDVRYLVTTRAALHARASRSAWTPKPARAGPCAASRA